MPPTTTFEPLDVGTAPNRVRVALLDGLRVEVEGHQVNLGRRQNELLLARLALSAPSVISLDSLIDALWNDHPPASARKNLQKCISELRRQIGPEAIRTATVGYVLDIPIENIDINEFSQLVDRARAARARDQLEEAWTGYERALQLWGDRPLDGLEDVEFVADESRRLEEIRLVVLEEQIEVGMELGRHADLIPTLEELVKRHPTRERVWGSLMLALYRSGRQADALATYRRLRDTLKEELGIEPSPEVRRLEEQILLHDPKLRWAPKAAGLGNAPHSYSTFIGRNEELAHLASLVRDSRLVTLTGPGGSGKTRLGLELMEAIADSYSGGTWFVDLALVSEPSGIASAVAAVFGLSDEPGVAVLDTVLGFLEGTQLLLLLDNCEHLGPDVAGLAAAILERCPRVTLLATSREPLGMTGESLFPLAPLPVPAEDETDSGQLEEIDSIRLFVDRATATDPGFGLSSEIAPAVADICRRLDGIPLAVELAARQLHVLGLHELHRGLVDYLDLAAPGEPAERHRTMEAAITWSYRLLSDEERRLFLALSVLPGSFSADAAQRISLVAEDAVTRLLAALVNRSMVVRLGNQNGARYRLLEPIRAYAARQAADEGLSDSHQRAHCEWVQELFSACTPIRGPHEREYLKRLSAEHHHLLTALEWATSNDPELALRLLVVAVPYTQMVVYRFRWTETAPLAIAEDSSIDPHLRAEAMAMGSEALAENFEHEKVTAWAGAALELAERLGDESTAGYALVSMGWSYRGTGALEAAEDHLLRAIERFERANNPIGIGHALHSLSFVLMAQGRYRETLETCTAALDVWLRLGSDWGAGRAWWHIAAAHTREGAYEEARDAVTRALTYFEDFEDLGSVTHIRAVEGDIARFSGDLERAREVYLSCLQGFQEVGDRRCIASTFKNLGLVARLLEKDAEAVPLFQAGLRRRYELGDLAGVTECLEGLGFLAHRAGRNEAAVTLFAVAGRLRDDTRASPAPQEQKEIHATLGALRSTVGLDRFRQLWDGARALPLERVLDEAQSLRSAA